YSAVAHCARALAKPITKLENFCVRIVTLARAYFGLAFALFLSAIVNARTARRQARNKSAPSTPVVAAYSSPATAQTLSKVGGLSGGPSENLKIKLTATSAQNLLTGSAVGWFFSASAQTWIKYSNPNSNGKPTIRKRSSGEALSICCFSLR